MNKSDSRTYEQNQETDNKLRRFGGWALLISAAISLLSATWDNIIGGLPTPLLRGIVLFGSLLFIAGLPAIQLRLPQMGYAGQVGLSLMAIGAIMAFVINLLFLAGSNISDGVIFTSALLGFLGTLIVGWRTSQVHVIPIWIGWLLIAGGVLNFASGFVDGSVAVILGFIGAVAVAFAIAGYGWNIVYQPAVT